MLDPTITAAAFVTVVAALGGVTVQIINARASATDRRLASEERKALSQKTESTLVATVNTEKKADTIIEKAVEIHTLTNSNLSKVTASLEVALARIDGLQKLVASMIEAKDATAAVAQAAGVAAATAAVRASFLSGAQSPHNRRSTDHPPIITDKLNAIQTTTEAIDAKVDEIKDATTHPPANAKP